MTTTIEETVKSSTRETLVARAEGLVDQLWAHAPDADRDRRIDEHDFVAMREAGLLQLFVPTRFGGPGQSMRTLYEVGAALGRGDTSAAWLSGVLNTGAWMAAQFPQQAQEEVWGDNPHATASGTPATDSTGTVVDGGRRVSGRWPYASGSIHSEWAVLGVPGLDPSGPADIVLIPMSEVTIDDTWHVTGMRATASHTIVADDVFVPAHRILSMVDMGGPDAPHAPDTAHRVALPGILPVSLLGPQIGAAGAALAHVVEKAPKRAIAYSTFANQTESAPFQVDIADASSRIDGARLLGAQAADEIDDYARRGEMPDVSVRARVRANTTAAATMARDAVDLLVSAHGTSSFAEVNPLQRLWRDTAVASRHLAFNSRLSQQMYGSALLGLDPRAISPIV